MLLHLSWPNLTHCNGMFSEPLEWTESLPSLVINIDLKLQPPQFSTKYTLDTVQKTLMWWSLPYLWIFEFFISYQERMKMKTRSRIHQRMLVIYFFYFLYYVITMCIFLLFWVLLFHGLPLNPLCFAHTVFSPISTCRSLLYSDTFQTRLPCSDVPSYLFFPVAINIS